MLFKLKRSRRTGIGEKRMSEVKETTVKRKLSLSSLLTPSKTVEVDYPGFPGFKIQLTYLGRDELLKLRKKATTTKFDRKTRQPLDEVDDDVFMQLYSDAVINGWSGFKYKYLAQLTPIDDSGVDATDTLDYSSDDAYILMKHSPDFDGFIADTVGDLQNFTTNS
jgi:hypothetical protein